MQTTEQGLGKGVSMVGKEVDVMGRYLLEEQVRKGCWWGENVRT